MLKNFIVMLIMLLTFQIHVTAQSDEFMKSVLYLSGADSEEELDEHELERYHALVSSPLEINLAARSRLLSCGVFSQYQVASLLDYRSRFGDVLSVSELALIEGFGTDFANALKPFVSFRSNLLPGETGEKSGKFSNEMLARSAVKGGKLNYGAKYRMTAGEMLEFSAAARTTYSDKNHLLPSSWSMNMTCCGNKILGKVIIGDFNARFGQGLSLWSGMSLSGLSSSSSFSKRPSGLSPSWSWSGIGSHRGLAADFMISDRLILSTFASFPGFRSWCETGKAAEISMMAGTNLTLYSRRGQFSATGYCETGPVNTSVEPRAGKLSGDFRYSWRGVDYFGEFAWDFSGKCPGFVFGTVIALKDDWKISSMLHSYASDFGSDFTGGVRSWTKTSDEHGLTVGVEKKTAYMTADFALKDSDCRKKQIRLLLKIPVQLTANSVLSVRISERYRTYEEILKYRTGARIDCDWSSSGLSAAYGSDCKPSWRSRLRVEGLLCRSLSGLTYLEGGRQTDRYSAWLRGTIFIVDNWDDRIYSYERDAPGNFTVPAYYGRGWSISAVAGSKFRFGKRMFRVLRMYFRVSAVGYSFMKDPKPFTSEAKIQASMRF